MTQFITGKATKSNPLLLPTSTLLIMFDSTGNIALHFGEVGRGTIRSAGGPFPLTFCILFFLLKKEKKKVLYGFLTLRASWHWHGNSWGRVSPCLLSKNWFTGGEAPRVSAASCFLWVSEGTRVPSDEKQVRYFCYNSLLSEMSFHVFPGN